MPENLLNIIAVSLYIFVIIGAIISFILNRFAPVKSVKAEVVNKQINETFSRYSGTGKRKKYVIVFLAEGKKKFFYVSQFSYNGYRVGEKGTLKYKGDRLIGFQ